MPDERPNVLFVVLDTARASAFETGSDSRTPTYAAIAARGTEFAHAIAPAPWTLPSHVSFFSGLMPSEHGMMGDAWPANELPNVHPVIERAAGAWLPAAAQQAGYDTFAAVANGWVGPRTGFDANFDTFFTTVSRAGAGRSVSRRARDRIRSRLHPGDDGAGRLAGSFDQWHGTRQDKRKPFFAFFNFLEPHAPYDPPGWRRLLSPEHRRRATELLDELNRPADLMLPYNLRRRDLSSEDLTILRKLYEAEVSVADQAAGHILGRIEAAGELDRTIVVLASDHGENIGEHHLLAHNMSLHETLVHVPLVIAGPGVPRERRTGTVSALGIHPTLLEAITGSEQAGSLLTAPSPDVLSEYESAKYQVRALAPLLAEADTGVSTKRQPALATHKGVAAYRGSHKAIATPDAVEVFDVSTDPGEQAPLAGTLPDTAVAATTAATSALARLEAASPVSPDTAVLDEEIRVHLEGLGYL